MLNNMRELRLDILVLKDRHARKEEKNRKWKESQSLKFGEWVSFNALYC